MYAHSRAKHTDPEKHWGRHHDAGEQEYWYPSQKGENLFKKSWTVCRLLELIFVQLDDVVDSRHEDKDRFEEARHRTVRWLDK